MITAVETDAIVAPFGLLRVAALPAETLRPLTLPSSHLIVAALGDIQVALDALRRPVTEMLHALVPGLDGEDVVRGQVVNLRRDVHNDRVPHFGEKAFDGIARRLEPGDRADLLAWRDIMARRVALLAALDESITYELAVAGKALSTAVSSPDLLGGVAASSDSFYSTLLTIRPEQFGDPTRRDVRSLVTYVARAVLKTSPFSSFTTLRLLRNGVLQEAPMRRLRSHTVPLLRWTLLQACALDVDLAPAFQYEAVPTWKTDDGRTRALLPHVAIMGDIYGSFDCLADLTLYAESLSALTGVGPTSYASILEHLPGRDPRLTLRRLLEIGVVRVVAPWDEEDAQPMAKVASGLMDLRTSRGAEAAAHLHAVVEAENLLEEPDVERRQRARRDLRHQTTAALSALEAPLPTWVKSGTLAFENVVDVSLPAGIATFPEQLRDDLQQIAALVRPSVFRSRLYDELLQTFVQRFGIGGVCEHVMRFLDEFLSGPDIRSLLQRVVERDRAGADGVSCPTIAPVRSPSSAPASITVLFQLASHDDNALARGDYLVVVNQYSAGLGGLLARLSSLFPGPDGLAEELRRWVHGCYPDARVAEVLPARNVSSLADASSGLFPTLRWPSDCPTLQSSATLGIEELQLFHDACADALVLRTAAGSPVAVPNLGTVPDYLVVGPLRLLLTISNPWVVSSRLSDHARVATGEPVKAVTFVPRDQRGRLVLRRARWLVPGFLFPLRNRGERDGAYLLRVDAWRRSHDVADEVYLSVEASNLGDAFNKDRKPRWVSFSSLHALDALKGVVSANLESTLSLVEALPARNQYWARDRDGQSRATEIMALLRWDSVPDREGLHDGN